jgi:hypothetical protein
LTAGLAINGTALDMWWKGKVPPEIGRLLGSAKVPVTVHKAAYSQTELEKAAARLETDMRTNPKTVLHSIRYLADGSGVAVGTTAATARTARETLDRLAGPLPVKVIPSPGWELHTWRQGDTMNFWGGGRIVNISAGLLCSAGFAIASGAGMLTAGHCGERGEEFANGDQSVRYGWARRKHTGHDLLLIPTNAEGRIYFGDVDIPKTHAMSKAVVGWDWAWPGELVCQSGATSGTVCGTRNTDTYALSYCTTHRGRRLCLSDMIIAESITHQAPSRRGDSGGPVFTFASSESNEPRVIAKGIVSGGVGHRMVYQDFGTAWRDFGILPASG